LLIVVLQVLAYMGVVVLGWLTKTIQDIEGRILLALAHSCVSPTLFICVGGEIIINYIRGLATYIILIAMYLQ